MDLLGNLANLKVDTVLSAVDKYVPGAQNKIKNLADKAKAYVNNVSELELKVLEATNHDPWGPHGSVMQEITNNCFHSEGFYQIMGVIDQRLQECPENWRLVYKTLLLLEYMVKHGPLSVSEAVLSYSRMSQLEKLRDRFEFKEATGRDQGVNVRQRAGALVSLVQDRDKLNEERDKAAKNKSKYTGVSSNSMRYGGFGPGSGSSSNYSSSQDHTSYGSSGLGSSGGLGTSSSSTHRRSSGGGASDGTGRVEPAAGSDDAVEATRQRIARLKMEGALPDAQGDSPGAAPGLDAADGSPKKPKKLSEIKINPAISATFAKGGLAPPPASGGGSKRGTAGGVGPCQASAAFGIDLLGDLSDSYQPTATPAAIPGSTNGVDEWDGFASASSAAAPAPAVVAPQATGKAALDDWAAFDSAPPAGSTQTSQVRQPIDINSLLGPLPTTTAAAAAHSGPAGVKAPLPLDDFCSVQHTPAPAPAVAPAYDPFSASAAPGPTPPAAAAAASHDPFAASSAVHVMAQAAKQQPASPAVPKLGPETAKAKDPFADLALI